MICRATVLLLILLASPAFPAARAEIVDRVAAVVNDRVITLSDVEWSFLGGEAPLPEDPDGRREALEARMNQLIEQELVAQEVEKEPLFTLNEQEVEAELNKLQARYGSREKLMAEAEKSGLTPEQLRVIVRRQLSVLKFIDVRLRPFIIVTPEETAAYYRETLTAELKKEGILDPPPLDQVNGRIEGLLIEQKVDQELQKWLGNAKKRARIMILLNRAESPNAPPEELIH